MRVRIGQYSQPLILRGAFESAGVRHDQTVRADLRLVQVTPNGELRFCPMASQPNPVLIHAIEGDGDGYPLPFDVTIMGSFNAPGPGFYNLSNIKARLNGSIQLQPTLATRFEKVPIRVLVSG